MKIALVGAQGVGKTTLANWLKDKHGGVIVPEVARDCPYGVDTEADFRTEWWIISHAILAEKEVARQNPKLVVADRSVMDLMVYSSLVNQADERRVSDDEVDFIGVVAQFWMSLAPYDHIIFLRVSDDVWKKRDLDDGFRSTSFDWYQKLTGRFADLLTALEPGLETTQVHTIYNDGDEKALFADVEKKLGL